MRIVVWWNELSRAYQNAIVLFITDSLLLIGALVNLPFLHATWDALTEAIPNIFELIVMQAIALVRDVAPGAIVASPVLVVYGTVFLSLLCVHLVVGFGIGFLYDHTQRTVWWSFANFFTLIMVLFLIHFFLLISMVGTV